MKNFIQPGETIDVVLPYDVSSGDGVIVGGLFGLATIAGKNGDTVPVKTRGVFEVKKNSAEAWATVGIQIYWDNTNKVFTTTATNNTAVAHNTATAANPSATGIVLLDR